MLCRGFLHCDLEHLALSVARALTSTGCQEQLHEGWTRQVHGAAMSCPQAPCFTAHMPHQAAVGAQGAHKEELLRLGGGPCSRRTRAWKGLAAMVPFIVKVQGCMSHISYTPTIPYHPPIDEGKKALVHITCKLPDTVSMPGLTCVALCGVRQVHQTLLPRQQPKAVGRLIHGPCACMGMG